jgi:hypothetical protein
VVAEYTHAWRHFARLAHDPEANPSAARLRDHMLRRLIAELEAA